LNNGGYFQFAWELTDAATNAPLVCADVVGENGVSILSTLVGTQDAFDDTFDCEDGANVTGGIFAGNYEVSVSILNAQGQATDTAPTINGTIEPQNRITDLGVITIPVN
ncbi:MAG: hypothetical protein H0T79_11590, partial [Deltaproteobacteria bacterium]|nr:hypothetical protein [Deltaproteobacteria bacterium]